MRLHLASAADNETLVLFEDAVHAAARQRKLLQDRDLLPRHVRVADQERCAARLASPEPTNQAALPSTFSGAIGLANASKFPLLRYMVRSFRVK